MKSNSFRLPSKATAVLLLCTGLVASHPLALWAEDGVTTVQAVQQQQVIVKGTVSDAMGPVIGANVIEKGNRGNGTITDIDGNFSLKVKPGATLEIHYIGYKTVEVKAVPGKPLNVTLTEDSEMLDEVVVVGYGTMRRKDVTGSVVQIRPTAMQNEAPKTRARRASRRTGSEGGARHVGQRRRLTRNPWRPLAVQPDGRLSDDYP